jgi:protein-tyrosine phosphatase
VAKTVLVVCQANTCRSVMAQVLLEKMLAARGVDGRVRVRSGGIGPHARDGMIPSLDARIVLREEGIHLAEDTIVSTDLNSHADVLAGADVILTMTEDQKRLVRARLDGTDRAVYTLGELAGEEGDVRDPVGQDESRYRATRDLIKRRLEASLDRLLRLLG